MLDDFATCLYAFTPTVLQIILRQFNASTAGGQRKRGLLLDTFQLTEEMKG